MGKKNLNDEFKTASLDQHANWEKYVPDNIATVKLDPHVTYTIKWYELLQL